VPIASVGFREYPLGKEFLMSKDNKAKTKVDEIANEVGALRKLWEKNRRLTLGVIAIGSCMIAAWLLPKAWDLVKILAYPEVVALRQDKGNLQSKVEAVTNELQQRTRERDAKITELAGMTQERDSALANLNKLKNTVCL
jgi:hypothetical protein